MIGRRIGRSQSLSLVARGSDRGIFDLDDDNVALSLSLLVVQFHDDIHLVFGLCLCIFIKLYTIQPLMYIFTTIGLDPARVFPSHRVDIHDMIIDTTNISQLGVTMSKCSNKSQMTLFESEVRFDLTRFCRSPTGCRSPHRIRPS
jgi:hypothetical protein